ncbi:MAG TPA: Nif11-like leader peptide family natural product precursor [Chlorobaculum parvum]|uniref:Nif11-like leader peptide family natural product n=1 Tax=Chlorobaculum parvum TaxID=274539 RepID=A0A7C5DCS6_9CHLB|nr:Nif11-like leader peptide family natural product precursor [Chlorobaculum parvum]
MPKSSAIDFLEKMKSDSELADKVNNAENKEIRWKIIRDAGFDFTREELDHATVEALNHFERWSWEARLIADWL